MEALSGDQAAAGSGGAAAQVKPRSGAPRACPKATRDKEATPAPSGDGDDADGGAMSKRTCQLVETSSAAGGKRIKEVVFGLLSPEEMESLAEFECNNRELYTLPSRKPAPNGCLDLRLGAANKQTACATCHKRVDQRGAGVFRGLMTPLSQILVSIP